MSDAVAFPTNIVLALAEFAADIDDVELVLKRPLRATDPGHSIGIVAVDWIPKDWQIGQWDPALATYLFQIQGFIKHTDEEEGLAAHSLFAKNIRLMLYRNQALRVRLTALTEIHDGFTERVLRWGLRQQRFASNEISGEFLHLSTSEVFVETETV